MGVSLQVEVLSYPERGRWGREGEMLFIPSLQTPGGLVAFAERRGTEYDPIITGAPLLHS